MGVSENSVPLNPMVLLIIIPMKNGYFIGNINPTFSDKPIYVHYMPIVTIFQWEIAARFRAKMAGCGAMMPQILRRSTGATWAPARGWRFWASGAPGFLGEKPMEQV